MMKYDRSLQEVWDWKEKVYQEVKDFTPSEYLEKLDFDAGSLMLYAWDKTSNCAARRYAVSGIV